MYVTNQVFWNVAPDVGNSFDIMLMQLSTGHIARCARVIAMADDNCKNCQVMQILLRFKWNLNKGGSVKEAYDAAVENREYVRGW